MPEPDTSTGNDQHKPRRLIIDSPVLHIEEVRQPDIKREKKLKDYASDQGTGWLKPMAGDQGRPSLISIPFTMHIGLLLVPLGLASALGYMHLGQLARVKVPQHFMHEAVKQEDGEGVRPGVG
eukprot:gene8917-9094_t